MSVKSDLRRELKRVESLHLCIDLFMEKALAQLESPCRPGCDHCCRQVVFATLAEALYLAVELDSRWRNNSPKRLLLEKCGIIMKRILSGKLTMATWWEEQIPCVFLSETGLCGVYHHRPTACRSHAVTTESDCSKESLTGGSMILDKSEILRESFIVSKEVSDKFRLPLGYAPLPVALTWAFTAYDAGMGTLRSYLKGTIFENDLEATKVWATKLNYNLGAGGIDGDVTIKRADSEREPSSNLHNSSRFQKPS